MFVRMVVLLLGGALSACSSVDLSQYRSPNSLQTFDSISELHRYGEKKMEAIETVEKRVTKEEYWGGFWGVV